MADEARNVAQPPPDVSHARCLVDAEVVGDGVHVQEPKDEPSDGDRADECERNQDKARDSVGREGVAGDVAAARALHRPGAILWPSAWILRRVQMANGDLPAKAEFGERPAKRDDEAWKGVRTKASFTGRFFAARKGFVRPLPSR